MTDTQASTHAPSTSDEIHSWSITFRGEYQLKEGFPVFEPMLQLSSSSTKWQAQIHQTDPKKPVMIICKGKKDKIEDRVSEDGDFETKAPWIIFDQSGLLRKVKLNLDTIQQTTNIMQQIGSTENVSIRATIRNEACVDKDDFGGKIEEKILAKQSLLIDTLNKVALHQSEEVVDLSTVKNARPILFLDQNNDGFLLLAEVVDIDNNRRILFSYMDAPRSQTQEITIGTQQRWIISRPFTVEKDVPEYTIRVHQDGDISRPHVNLDSGLIYRYLEFWVNNLPLGIHVLSSTYLPFKGDFSRIGIGCWPKKGGTLYFKGGMGEIIVDPHGLCPCPA